MDFRSEVGNWVKICLKFDFHQHFDLSAQIEFLMVPLILGDDSAARMRFIIIFVCSGNILVFVVPQISLVVTHQILGQGNLEFNLWWFHWVRNVKVSSVIYVICVYGVLNESQRSISWISCLKFVDIWCHVLCSRDMPSTFVKVLDLDTWVREGSTTFVKGLLPNPSHSKIVSPRSRRSVWPWFLRSQALGCDRGELSF